MTKYKGDVVGQRLRRRDRALQFLWDYKAANPCTDCGGYFHPFVMDLDHVDPTNKTDKVSSYTYSIARLQEEIEKCELVCANCHRMRTLAQNPSIGVNWVCKSPP